ncbi:MAG: aa3-type cytochrome c oxidase subunit IV [Pseudomonadota bacterium]
MSEHEHGSMDTTEQQKTFLGFIKASAYVIVVSTAIIVFLAFVGT